MSWFTYSACGPSAKNKERIKKLKKQEIQEIFIKMNWTKLVLNMIWFSTWDFKDLNSRTFADKVLRDKAFNIAKDAYIMNIMWICFDGL